MDGIISGPVSASIARAKLNRILDDAENGKATVILRYAKPVAVVIPAHELGAFRVFQGIVTEVAETLEISNDPAIVAAVREAQADIDGGNVVWR